MEAIKIPKTLKFYQLVKMTTNAGLTFSLVGFSNGIINLPMECISNMEDIL